MIGGHHSTGNYIKDRSIRQSENHCSPALSYSSFINICFFEDKHTFVGQRTTYRGWSSPSTKWVLEIELGFWGLAAGPFTCQAISLTCLIFKF